MPSECRSREEFVAEVAEWLSDARPVDPEDAIRSVFKVLSRHVSRGQIDHVKQALPKPVRQMWDDMEAPELVQEPEEMSLTPQI